MRYRNWTPRERDRAVKQLNRATAVAATAALAATAGFAIMMLPTSAATVATPATQNSMTQQPGSAESLEDGDSDEGWTSDGETTGATNGGTTNYPNTVTVPQPAAPHTNSGSS